MLVTVLLRPESISGLETDSSLRHLLTEFQTVLVPQHPGVADPELARYYAAEVADPGEATRMAAALRTSPAVEAAYVKPPEALP